MGPRCDRRDAPGGPRADEISERWVEGVRRRHENDAVFVNAERLVLTCAVQSQSAVLGETTFWAAGAAGREEDVRQFTIRERRRRSDRPFVRLGGVRLNDQLGRVDDFNVVRVDGQCNSHLQPTQRLSVTRARTRDHDGTLGVVEDAFDPCRRVLGAHRHHGRVREENREDGHRQLDSVLHEQSHGRRQAVTRVLHLRQPRRVDADERIAHARRGG